MGDLECTNIKMKGMRKLGKTIATKKGKKNRRERQGKRKEGKASFKLGFKLN